MGNTMQPDQAWRAGYRDGLAWELDGYTTREQLLQDKTGWDEAMLSAVGLEMCAEEWGFKLDKDGDPEEAEFSLACASYNAGCYAGAIEPQQYRTGSPVTSERLRDYYSRIGRKGGATGRGAKKARSSEQARTAARARWQSERVK